MADATNESTENKPKGNVIANALRSISETTQTWADNVNVNVKKRQLTEQLTQAQALVGKITDQLAELG